MARTAKGKKRMAERDYLRQLHGLVDEIYSVAHNSHGWNWRRLAEKAGLSYNTVYALGERKTRFPEYRTVYKLAKAVGMTVGLKKLEKKLRKAA